MKKWKREERENIGIKIKWNNLYSLIIFIYLYTSIHQVCIYVAHFWMWIKYSEHKYRYI